MNKIELEIVALSHSVTQSNSYAVVLAEVGGIRRLPVVIGGFEAQSIAVAIENVTPPRPLTHDLIKNLFESFNIELTSVVISDLQDGVFYAKLICMNGGEEVEIDSRTSDAIAIAVRYNCPIYTYEFILDQAGIVLEESVKELEAEGELEEIEEPTGLGKYNLEELNQMLSEAVDAEDYARAAEIRDEINKRQQN